MNRICMVPAAELVEDFDLYPRNSVNSVCVGDYARALEAGVDFPPIIADKKSKRIVDGFKRRRAWMKIGGDEAQVPVVWKEYASEADLLEEAMSSNGKHGEQFQRQDQIRCTILAKKFRLSDERLAMALNVTRERVQELKVRVIIPASSPRQPIPSKPVSAYLEGQKATDEQVEVVKHFGGYDLLRTVSQVTKAVEARLFDPSDIRILHALHRLAKLIADNVPRQVA